MTAMMMEVSRIQTTIQASRNGRPRTSGVAQLTKNGPTMRVRNGTAASQRIVRMNTTLCCRENLPPPRRFRAVPGNEAVFCRSANLCVCALALQPEAQQHDGRGVFGGRHARTQPFLAQLGLELHHAIELVNKRAGDRVAVVLARRADIVVDAVIELHRTDQPAAERMLDLEADVAGEDARGAGHCRL